MRERLEGIVARTAAPERQAIGRRVRDTGLSILLVAGGDVYALRTEGSLTIRDYRTQAAVETPLA